VSGGPQFSRQPVENVPAVNVHKLAAAGALREGAVTTWSIGLGLTVEVRRTGARAVFKIGDHVTVARLAIVPGTRGGSWSLLCCPICDRRIWHLYFWAGCLACRSCHKLAYESQIKHVPGPLLKARRLRMRYGAEDLHPLAPLRKRAGWAGRWYREIMALEASGITGLSSMVAAFERRRKRDDGR
jgi:hypothetical protein